MKLKIIIKMFKPYRYSDRVFRVLNKYWVIKNLDNSVSSKYYSSSTADAEDNAEEMPGVEDL